MEIARELPVFRQSDRKLIASSRKLPRGSSWRYRQLSRDRSSGATLEPLPSDYPGNPKKTGQVRAKGCLQQVVEAGRRTGRRIDRRAFRSYRPVRANDISVFPSNLAALQAILKQFYTSPECRKWLESGKDRKRSTTERHGKSERGWG